MAAWAEVDAFFQRIFSRDPSGAARRVFEPAYSLWQQVVFDPEQSTQRKRNLFKEEEDSHQWLAQRDRQILREDRYTPSLREEIESKVRHNEVMRDMAAGLRAGAEADMAWARRRRAMMERAIHDGMIQGPFGRLPKDLFRTEVMSRVP